MNNYQEFLEELRKKITAEKFRNEITSGLEILKNEQLQKKYNDDIAQKTLKYQQKFGFETNPRKGHEFWNVEADAFKHAFGSADMYFKYGNAGSLYAGIEHENKTPHNPQGEWNMDSWNNHQGREIAREIKKEYGDNFYKLPQEQQDNIKAVKVMDRMRNGELITHPDDPRKYNGVIEGISNTAKKLQEGTFFKTRGQSTGQAAPVSFDHIFTPQEIGSMSDNDFERHEHTISQQAAQGLIKSQSSQRKDFSGWKNPFNNDNRIFTRESIGEMDDNEFETHEKAIDAQLSKIGIPTNSEMQNSFGAVYVAPYTRADGVQVKGYYRSR